MTTPTKEQIEHIRKNTPTFVCEFDVECIPSSEVVEKIITEWEKIKDLDARVEKMCKNNPGIKDFEDFYKARNSLK